MFYVDGYCRRFYCSNEGKSFMLMSFDLLQMEEKFIRFLNLKINSNFCYMRNKPSMIKKRYARRTKSIISHLKIVVTNGT